jgi:TatD DNase family protein
MPGPIDTHTHLDFAQYDEDRATVISQSLELLSGLVAIGVDLPTSRAAVALADSHDHIRAAVGIHPHEADKVSADDLTALAEIAGQPNVVAIGECGLDYYRDLSTPANQDKLFAFQIDLALRLGLPLVIHQRDAYEEGHETLHQRYIANAPKEPGVIHSFGGDIVMAKKFLEDGWTLGINATLTYPKNDSLREVVANTPLEKIVLETDCPFLPPQDLRGSRNEPKSVLVIAELVAELKNVPVDTVVEITNHNAKRIFKLT